MFLLYHAYVYLEFLILACTIYILAPFGFNGKVQILAPKSVKEQYRQMIAKADENMQESE